ncbi:MAG: N-acetylmuramic acid 6-phosphate etherase [Clostridiaceae bacterium]|nr:N-acetylmuramic acid 6-phosphate etherase [Clostridiaceae bacterium]MBW4861130.1 N-acetylmuramic acid 6-phosphate etherase [Clostridiaceae bacterium]MBW4869874.1 N-acetylmuramic acid 6-phosphate etherase [Clostridiaceae bacterium]
MPTMDLNKLITEGINENTQSIDKVSTLEMIKMINEEDKKVALAIEEVLPKIAEAIDITAKKIYEGGRLIYIGAGTSGRIGILDASECPPTFGVDPYLVQGLIAGGHRAIFEAVEGAEDSKELAKEDLKEIEFTSKDVLIGLAASGRTPYTIGGLEYANKLGSFTVGITCNPNSELSKVAQVSINPIVGPEVISGSTRLKAGTAQKMVLNMISTGVMVKLGKVYGNLMVDVKAQNAKLVERAKRLVVKATGTSIEEATKILEKTDYNVKLSILLIKTNLDLEKAIRILNNNKGYLSKAIEEGLSE